MLFHELSLAHGFPTLVSLRFRLTWRWSRPYIVLWSSCPQMRAFQRQGGAQKAEIHTLRREKPFAHGTKLLSEVDAGGGQVPLQGKFCAHENTNV